MFDAAAICEAGGPMPTCYSPSSASVPNLTDCRVRTIVRVPTRVSKVQRGQSHSERQVLGVSDASSPESRAARLLLVSDDDAVTSTQLRRAISSPEHQVAVARSCSNALDNVRACPPDVIVFDLGLANHLSLEVYRQIRCIDVGVPVIFVAGSGQGNLAIEVIKQGAYDCVYKPVDASRLRHAVANAFEVAWRMRQPTALEEIEMDPDNDSDIIGNCPAMGEVYNAIGRVADQTFPVLITGESGTGKELIARAIYQHGARASAPFLTLNCAAIPENLLESELFGHEKGAFTGADRRRIGKFEQCNGGTIFLDEIGDMPLALQAKVLRILQEQAFERVGGNETIRTDVRIIAATHRDLKAWSAEGKFRLDLYYRLSVFPMHLPPLRDRGDDLTTLVQHYVRRFSKELGRKVHLVAPDAMEHLRRYTWPGNIRELQNVLKQALLRASGSTLLASFLPERLRAADPPAQPASLEAATDAETFIVRQQLSSDIRNAYTDTHRQLDRLLLSRVMEYTDGNVQQAALMLGIARQTLRLKLRDLGLSVPNSGGSED
jgi:DNA-binding NtrC family response regulator